MAMSIGMMSGAFITPKLSKSNATVSVSAGIFMGITLIGMGVVPNAMIIENIKTVLVLFCAWALGFGGGIQSVISGGLTIRAVPVEMMGRMTGVISSLMMVSMPITSFVCSVAVNYLTVLQVLIIAGIMAIGIFIWLHTSQKILSLNS